MQTLPTTYTDVRPHDLISQTPVRETAGLVVVDLGACRFVLDHAHTDTDSLRRYAEILDEVVVGLKQTACDRAKRTTYSKMSYRPSSSNPDKLLDGAWEVVNAGGSVIIRYDDDGRDQCEEYIAKRLAETYRTGPFADPRTHRDTIRQRVDVTA